MGWRELANEVQIDEADEIGEANSSCFVFYTPSEFVSTIQRLREVYGQRILHPTTASSHRMSPWNEFGREGEKVGEGTKVTWILQSN
jgi:hypothetical protein